MLYDFQQRCIFYMKLLIRPQSWQSIELDHQVNYYFYHPHKTNCLFHPANENAFF